MENWEVLKDKAKACLEDGKFEEAIGYFTEIIEGGVEDAEVYFYRGSAKLVLKKYKTALEDYRQATTLNQEYTHAFYFGGIVKFSLSRYQAAIKDFSQTIKLDPKHANAYYHRGLVKVQLKVYQAAVEDLSQTIKLNPQNADAYHHRGLARGQLKSYQAAVRDLSRAVELNPKKADTYVGLGAIKMELEKYEAAKEDFSRAIKLNPKNETAYYSRAKCKGFLKRYQDAIEDFDQIIRLNPNNVDAYYLRGKLKVNLMLNQAAISDFDQAININPQDPEIYLIRGATKSKLGHFEQAIKDYDQVIKLSPKNANAYQVRGLAMASLGCYQAAIEDFDEAIKIDPKHSISYVNRGNSNIELKHYQEAIKDLNQAISIDSKYADAYSLRGLAKTYLKKYQAAIEDSNKAIKINPRHDGAYHNRALAKTHLKLYQEAIEDYGRAIQINGNHSKAYNNRGNIYEKLKRYQEAVDDYNQALNINPKYFEAYCNRGGARRLLRQYEAAIEDYNRAIELNPEFAIPHYGKFAIHWFDWQQLLPAQIHLNRFLYLASIEEVVQVWTDVTIFYRETSSSQPFLLRRVAKVIPVTQDFVSWQTLLQRTVTQCGILQQYFWYVEKELTEKVIAEKHRLKALLNYYMGDPMEAYHIYDEILDGELESISLMGQYYFIRSAMDFLEPHESLLRFALQDVEDYCSNNDPEADIREWYYAGMLYTLKEDWQRAYEIFGQLEGFLPAAVMQVVAAEALEKPESEMAQLKAKARSLVTSLPEAFAYQNGFPAVQLDLEREDFLTPFLHYANYREILEHIHIIQEEGVDFAYLECWEVWQLQPKDEQKIQRLQREKELEEIRARLEEIFEQNLKQRYQDYPEEKIKAHETKLRDTDADIRGVFETLEQKAAESPESLEKEFGLQIKRWDKHIEHPEAYLLMLKYFYVKQQLPEKPAFLLYFYTHFVGAKHKYPKFAKEGLHATGKWALETLLSPLPLGSLGAKVTTAVLWSLIQDAVKQNPQWEEDNLLSDYEQFKANFLNFLSEKVETMGRKRFLERYTLEGWEI